MRIALLVAVAIITISPRAFADNFAECILENMPGAQNAPVRLAAYKLCKEQYPGGFDSVPPGAGRGFFAKYDSGSECTIAEGRDTLDRHAAFLIASSCRKLYDEPAPWKEYGSATINNFLDDAPGVNTPVAQTPVPQVATSNSTGPGHFEMINAAHPDALNIAASARFIQWRDASTERVRVVNLGSAREVIALLNEYKAYTAKNKFAPDDSRPLGACEFKPVMTNDDYRACGITPPAR